MKKCLRQKCQKEFEPNKPKQVFCSAKCRVYFSREEKIDKVPIKGLPKYVQNKPEAPIKQLAEKSTMPDPKKDRAAYSRWLRENS